MSEKLNPIQRKILYKLSLIQKLEKEGVSKFPTFRAFVDGGDSIDLDATTYLGFEQIKSLMKFCEDNKCTFSIISSKQQKDIEEGWMRVEIFTHVIPSNNKRLDSSVQVNEVKKE